MLRLPVTARTLWALGIALVLLAGCYTVIVHPKIEGQKLSREYLRANCIDCHADYNVYPYDPYDYYFGANYFWEYPQFGYYYSYPWWWDQYYWDYYFFGDDPDFFNPLGLSLGGGEFDDREPMRPDYHGRNPRRSQGEVAQTDSSGIDTDPADDDEKPKEQVRTQPMHIPPDMSSPTLEGRTPGKPPWTRPKGWWGAKPPKLRVIAAELESRPKGGSKSSKTSTGKTVESSKSSSESSDEKKAESKTEEKTEEPEEPKRRGRPKRGPP